MPTRFAISDIHGCRKTFQALLSKIAFTKADTLYILGDYVDRGPDSKGVLDDIIKMQDFGYQIHCLKGNHEVMLLDSIKTSWNTADDELLNSFGISHVQYIPEHYIKWVKNLPLYIELEDYILVHAGLNFNIPNPLEDEESLLWIRDWHHHIRHDWLAGRVIVHGHTPRSKTEILSQAVSLGSDGYFDIDAGCCFHQYDNGLGNLCAFDMDTRQVHFERYRG